MELSVDIKKAAYRRHAVLENIRFTLSAGSFTAILGRNGSGKSTLLSCIAGILPFEGTICAGGIDLGTLSGRERARRIAVMLQQPRAPHITVEELVCFGRRPYHTFGHDRPDAPDLAKIEAAIQKTALEPLRHRYVDTLSGGEQRRAHFAAMLAQDTPVVLLDESTAFMDAENEARYLELAAAMQGQKTVLAVLHDLSAAVRYARRVIVLDEGTVCFDGTAAAFAASGIPEAVFHVRRYTAQDEHGEQALFFR